jgi:hypothetical protein
MAGVFRFLSAGRRGVYSVIRGDAHLGFVERITHRTQGRAIDAGWRPTTPYPAKRELAIEPTREAAAEALWKVRA